MTLTYAGKALLPHARALLDYMDNAILSVQELAAHQKGVIKLSCIPTATFYFLPKVLEKFNALYPNIRVHIHEQATMDSLDSLMSGETDFGINMNRVTHPQITFTPWLMSLIFWFAVATIRWRQRSWWSGMNWLPIA